MSHAPPPPPETLPPRALSGSEIRSLLVRSGLSSYALLFVRLASGVFLTRILFLSLPRVEYGLWALLWSFFGYALVLDFGFGVAMSKFTSQATVHGDWDELNRRLNTVLPLYAAMGLLIAVATLAAAPLLGSVLRFEGSPAEIAGYRDVLLVFGIGTACVFPLGVFGEVLAGLGRIPLRNGLSVVAAVLNFALLWAIVEAGLGLHIMAIASLGVSASMGLVMGAFVSRLVPGFRIDWRLFDRRLLRDTLSFSLFSYVITIGSLVLLRIDHLVVGSLLTVSLIAVYQVSWRLSEMFRQLSVQALEALGPIAAALFQSQSRDQLTRTLSDSSRVIAALAALFYLPLMVYLGPVLEIWLELTDPAALQCGWILLTAGFISVVFKGPTTRVLLMCRQERPLAIATVCEAALNLGLSVALCLYTGLGIVGVALGTLIPATLLSIGVYVPLAVRFTRVPVHRWLGETLFGPFVALALAAPVYELCRQLAAPTTLLGVAANAIPGGIVFLFVLTRFGLRRAERTALLRWSRDDPERVRAAGSFPRSNRLIYVDQPFAGGHGGDKNRSRFLTAALLERYRADLLLTLPPDAPDEGPGSHPGFDRVDCVRIATRWSASTAGGHRIDPATARALEERLRASDYELMVLRFASQAPLARLAARARPDLGIVIDCDMLLHRLADLAWQREWSLRNRFHLLSRFGLRRFESRLFREPYLFLFANPIERDLAAALGRGGPGRFGLLPNAVTPVADGRLAAGEGERGDRILFFGSSSVTNEDAIEHLVRDIVPRCRTLLSRHRLRIRIAGRFDKGLLDRLRDPVVEAVGEVPDMDAEIRAARFVLLPIRVASGTRTRILEAGRWAKAVVTTPIGAEGLDLPAEALMVRESAADQAAAIEALVEGRVDANRMGRALREAVLSRYHAKRVATELHEQIDAFATCLRSPR